MGSEDAKGELTPIFDGAFGLVDTTGGGRFFFSRHKAQDASAYLRLLARVLWSGRGSYLGMLQKSPVDVFFFHVPAGDFKY